MNNPKLNTIIAPYECQYDDAFGFQSNGVAKAFMCDDNKEKDVYFDEKGNIINQ